MAGRKERFLLVGSQSSTSSLVGSMPTTKKLTNGLRRPPAGGQSEACVRKEPCLGQFQSQSSFFAPDTRDQLRDILCVLFGSFCFSQPNSCLGNGGHIKVHLIYMQFYFCR